MLFFFFKTDAGMWKPDTLNDFTFRCLLGCGMKNKKTRMRRSRVWCCCCAVGRGSVEMFYISFMCTVIYSRQLLAFEWVRRCDWWLVLAILEFGLRYATFPFTMLCFLLPGHTTAARLLCIRVFGSHKRISIVPVWSVDPVAPFFCVRFLNPRIFSCSVVSEHAQVVNESSSFYFAFLGSCGMLNSFLKSKPDVALTHPIQPFF